MPKTVVSIGAGVSQVLLIKSARTRGYAVIAVDRDAQAPGFADATESVIVSTHDTAGVLAALEPLRTQYEFKGVVARVSGAALYTAAAVSHAFSLPGLTHKFVRIATEKSALRAWCEAHDVRAPRGQQIRSGAELSLQYPLILKPDQTQEEVDGKVGITRVRSQDELSAAFTAAQVASGNGFVEAEEYIEGADTAYLFLMQKGSVRSILYWDELVSIEPNGQIMGRGVARSRASDEARQRMAQAGAILAAQFPDVRALIIAAFRVAGDAPYLIEFHADLGGDNVAETFFPTIAPELDYFGLAVDVACNTI